MEGNDRAKVRTQRSIATNGQVVAIGSSAGS
jgi:hypothetical protein